MTKLEIFSTDCSMTDFAARFADLLQTLDDPDALFLGADTRDALLALEPLLPDQASEARLFRELALLEGKRNELTCLDHADRALSAHAKTGALSVDQLYFMHLVCGDVATAWAGGPRTAMHLDQALALHPKSGRSIGEAFAIRLNRGVHENTNGTARMGLDWYEPLLADAERHYGADSKELNRLLGLMSASEEKLGNLKQALAYGERSYALVDDSADRGRRVSALVTFATLNHRAGKAHKARQLFDEAIDFADANCSPATQRFARNEKLSVFPGNQATSPFDRLRGFFGRNKA